MTAPPRKRIAMRLASVVLGIAIAVLTLEAALRVASWVADTAQQRGRRVAPAGTFRVLCVGESTTAGIWPELLEENLRRRFPGLDVRVVKYGEVGARSDVIAERLPGWLDAHHPHVVITMVGINDEGNVLVYGHPGARLHIVDSSKLAKLVFLLWRSFRSDRQSAPGARDANKPPPAEAHWSDAVRRELGQLQERRLEAVRGFRYSELVEIQRTAIVTDPGNPVYHLGLLGSAITHYTPVDKLSTFFADQLGEPVTDPLTVDADARINDWAEAVGDRFAGVRIRASILRHQSAFAAEEALLETAAADPQLAGLASLRLAELYHTTNRPELVEPSLVRADEALADDYPWSLLLGRLGFSFGAYAESVAMYERALELRPDLPHSHRDVIYGWLAAASAMLGDHDRAAMWLSRRNHLSLGMFREFTRFNYNRIVDIIRSRDIPVVAMQYPTLPIEPLRKLLGYREDVFYCANQENFDAALRDHAYYEVFWDSFGGSFGHLTDLGNRLVADNVSDVVSRVIERSQPGTETR